MYIQQGVVDTKLLGRFVKQATINELVIPLPLVRVSALDSDEKHALLSTIHTAMLIPNAKDFNSYS